MSKILPVIFFTLLTCMVSCTSEKTRLENLIEQWQGREIRLPEVMTDALTGDTIDLSDKDFIIFSYVDSAGCTECQMKLPYWKVILKDFDTIRNSNYAMLMVVHPRDVRYAYNLLIKENFRRQVYLDTTNRVGESNGFPDNPMFQTFLLNGDRRVLAIGNPAIRNDVARLYLSLISGDFASDTESIGLRIPGNQEYDLGAIAVNDSARIECQLVNGNADSLRIRDVVSSCECTEAAFSDSVIALATARFYECFLKVIPWRENSIVQ